MSMNKKGKCKVLQSDIDYLKLELDDLCENQLPRLGAASPERMSLYNRTNEMQKNVAKLIKQLNNLNVGDEELPTRKLNKFIKEENQRLKNIESRLNDIREQLEPDEVEEDYFRRIQDVPTTDGNDDDDNDDDDNYDDYEIDDSDNYENVNEEDDVMRNNDQTNSQGTTVRALCDFTAEESHDLSFKKGEIIRVVEQSDDGWWTGQNSRGEVGIIPSTLVKMVSNNEVKTQQTERKVSPAKQTPSGDSLWDKLRNVQSDVAQPTSVSDVLQAMKAMPSGFRKPTLGTFHQDIMYRTSSWIIPKTSQSNVNFHDMFWDPINKQLRPFSSNSTRTFTLISAKFVPQFGAGVEILSRHAYISLWNGEKISSNIHLIRGVYLDKDGSWSFNLKIGKNTASLYDGDFIARTNTDDRRLSLLIELNYTYLRTSTGEKSDICCGWASLPLYQADGTPTPNKNYEIKLNGGAPFEKNVPLDRVFDQQPPPSLMQSLVGTNKQPRVLLKATSYNRIKKETFDALPETIVTCQSYCTFIAYFRQYAASVFCKDVQIPSGTVCDPVLAYFPRTLDYSDLMDALITYWDIKSRISLNRSQRRDKRHLEALFKSCYMESVFGIMHCSRFPSYQWADDRTEKARLAFISSYLQPVDLVTNLLSPEFQFRPINVSKIAFNAVSKYSEFPASISRETKVK